jgi:hypothetical protein
MSKNKIYKRIIKTNNSYTNNSYTNNKSYTNLTDNSYIVDPIQIELIQKSACLNDNVNFYSKYKCQTTQEDYKKNLYVPPIGIMSYDILRIYDIDSIDSLYKWFEEEFDKGTNIYNINRILNCWLKNNFNLINNNSYLGKIYYKLLVHLNSKNKKNNLEKEIKQFINNWVSKKSSNDFDFNLLEDLKKL